MESILKSIAAAFLALTKYKSKEELAAFSGLYGTELNKVWEAVIKVEELADMGIIKGGE